MGSSLCKILIIIVLARLKTWYDSQLTDQQQGFRSGRGTADAIFIMKRVQQITEKLKKPCYCLFVDLTAAFDHVVRDWLWRSIGQRFDDKNELVEILEAIYRETTTELAGHPEQIFELMSGVRQGGPESPTLYNLFMDYVMRAFVNECASKNIKFQKIKYRIRTSASTSRSSRSGTLVLDWIGYADDLILFFEDVGSLREALAVLNDTFTRFNLKINPKKTETMILTYKFSDGYTDDESYPPSIASLGKHNLKNTKEFCYLGDTICFKEAFTGDAEINFRISLAEQKFHELKTKLRNFKIPLSIRVKFLNAFVRARLTYSCQTWSLSTAQLNKINSCYINCLRKLLKNGFIRKDGKFLKKKDKYENDEVIEYSFRYSNDDVLKITKCENLEGFIMRLKTNYLAYLARQPNTTISKQLIFAVNDDNKKKGNSLDTLEESSWY